MLDGNLAKTGNDCKCHYCLKYDYLLKLISHHPKARWLTISPPAPMGGSAQKLFDDWLNDFMQFRKFATTLIGVGEFANERLHFHILFTTKDHIKQYKVLNNWRIGSQIRIYDGLPEKGIHYIFKDIKKAKDLIKKPVFTLDILDKLFIRKKNTILDTKANIIDQYD